MTVNVIRDVTEQHRAAMRDRLLADTGELLTRPAELDDRLARFAELAAPVLADLAVISLAEPDGRLRTTAAAHRDRAGRREGAPRAPPVRHTSGAAGRLPGGPRVRDRDGHRRPARRRLPRRDRPGRRPRAGDPHQPRRAAGGRRPVAGGGELPLHRLPHARRQGPRAGGGAGPPGRRDGAGRPGRHPRTPPPDGHHGARCGGHGRRGHPRPAGQPRCDPRHGTGDGPRRPARRPDPPAPGPPRRVVTRGRRARRPPGLGPGATRGRRRDARRAVAEQPACPDER